MQVSLALELQLPRKKCVRMLDTFNPKVTTVDAYMDDAKFLQDPMVGEVELKFIHQVFYGCHRYSKLLKLFVTSFVFKVPAIAVRSEQSLYQVLAYLLFFRPGDDSYEQPEHMHVQTGSAL